MFKHRAFFMVSLSAVLINRNLKWEELFKCKKITILKGNL